uniref:(+)-4R-limonene synthase n=1 Tax=Schizonepeta tenuifolia TaxID=2849020 RepID=Q9FUW5_9LAMI
MALKMTSAVMQMAIPTKLANFVNNSDTHKQSLKLLRNVSTISTSAAAATPRHRLPVCCSASSSSSSQLPTIERRSGNYKPSRWDVDFMQSLNSDYQEERHRTKASELITQVKNLLEKETSDDPIRQLELIDDLQRLGLSDHFEHEFKEVLNSIYLDNKYYNINIMKETTSSRDLYSTALAFRLLREHGFQVAQEVFDCFKNEEGEFKASLSDDPRGLLQLYEASFLFKEGENTLEIAREFATKLLQEKVNSSDEIDDNLLSSIRYSLEIPTYWSVIRPNVSVWIDAYRKRPDMNPVVLELAILDANIMQAQLQQELKEALGWWRNTWFVEKLPFARDRLVESYFWSTGMVPRRQHKTARQLMAKVIALITVMDDIYDVYGTLEELELFTDAFRRWDVSSIDHLPTYMQLCFLSINNFVVDTAYNILKETGVNVTTYLEKSWVDQAENYLMESKWFYSGHKPSLDEYLENSWISVSGPCVLTHEFFGVTDSLAKDTLDSLYEYHDIVRWSSYLLRLADDLGTSVEEVSRGDVPKSIQCYMNDNNASEEEAREHVKGLIRVMWKKMNAERVSEDSPFCKDFIRCCEDLGRMAQFMYHYGDGHGTQHAKIHQQITDCLFQPFA